MAMTNNPVVQLFPSALIASVAGQQWNLASIIFTFVRLRESFDVTVALNCVRRRVFSINGRQNVVALPPFLSQQYHFRLQCTSHAVRRNWRCFDYRRSLSLFGILQLCIELSSFAPMLYGYDPSAAFVKLEPLLPLARSLNG